VRGNVGPGAAGTDCLRGGGMKIDEKKIGTNLSVLLVATVGGVFREEVEAEGGERLLLVLVVPQQLQLSDGQHLGHALPHPAEEKVADADDSAFGAAETERSIERVRAVSRARLPHQLQ